MKRGQSAAVVGTSAYGQCHEVVLRAGRFERALLVPRSRPRILMLDELIDGYALEIKQSNMGSNIYSNTLLIQAVSTLPIFLEFLSSSYKSRKTSGPKNWLSFAILKRVWS